MFLCSGQDAILVVNTGGVCASSTFNSLALTPDLCIQCHCFDHSTQCKSADLFIREALDSAKNS